MKETMKNTFSETTTVESEPEKSKSVEIEKDYQFKIEQKTYKIDKFEDALIKFKEKGDIKKFTFKVKPFNGLDHDKCRLEIFKIERNNVSKNKQPKHNHFYTE